MQVNTASPGTYCTEYFVQVSFPDGRRPPTCGSPGLATHSYPKDRPSSSTSSITRQLDNMRRGFICGVKSN